MKCLQCGSTDIVLNVRAVDHSHGGGIVDLMLQVYTHPTAMIFKGTRSFPMHANVCVACGFVMLNVRSDHARRIQQIQPNRSDHPLDR